MTPAAALVAGAAGVAGAGGAGGVIADGSLLLAVPLALLAGLVSFASPCVLPLVPGYLAYVGGLAGAHPAGAHPPGAQPPGDHAVPHPPAAVPAPAGAVAPATGASAAPESPAPEIPAGRGRPTARAVLADPATVPTRRLVTGAALFVLGFTAVFVAVGATAGALGAALVRYDRVLAVAGGLVAVALGLAFAGLLPALDRQLRLPWRPATGLAGAPLLGATFGIGWTPCVGPTLGAVLVLATTDGSALRGAALAAVYCAGLGLPLVLVAAAYGRGLHRMTVLRRHQRALTRGGGVLLVVVGLLLLSGLWEQLTRALAGWTSSMVPIL